MLGEPLRENLTSGSYGEELETGPPQGPAPRQFLTRQLFFRWVNHTLKIRTSSHIQNAVRIQIAIALIAFLLLRAAHAIQNSVQSLLTFTRLIANNLMHRRPLDRLLEQPPPSIQNARQLSLNLCQI